MVQQPPTGPLSRFLRFTTQKEPILSAASLVAIALAIITRVVPLTDDDLQLLALLLLPFAPAVLARLRAWSPASVERTVEAHANRARLEGFTQGAESVRGLQRSVDRVDGTRTARSYAAGVTGQDIATDIRTGSLSVGEVRLAKDVIGEGSITVDPVHVDPDPHGGI